MKGSHLTFYHSQFIFQWYKDINLKKNTIPLFIKYEAVKDCVFLLIGGITH